MFYLDNIWTKFKGEMQSTGRGDLGKELSELYQCTGAFLLQYLHMAGANAPRSGSAPYLSQKWFWTIRKVLLKC